MIKLLKKNVSGKLFLEILLNQFSKTVFTPLFGNTMCLLHNLFQKYSKKDFRNRKCGYKRV